MSEHSRNLQLPFLAAGQAQKHVTVNESLLQLDALVQARVVSRQIAVEPEAPEDGSLYILPPSKAGSAWEAMSADALAYWRDGAWVQLTPRAGWTVYVCDEGAHVVYSGADWRRIEGVRAGNRLHNAGFAVNQRQAVSNTDDTYCFDRWFVLTEAGAITASALVDPEIGRPTGIRLTQTHAGAQRFAIAQIVESADIRDLRTRAAAMAARVRCSVAGAVRMAILEWRGGADSVVSDVVQSWSNGSFTAGAFFNSANLAVVATGAVTVAPDIWCAPPQISGAFSEDMTNAIVMIWPEAALAQTETLDISDVQLEAGIACGPFVRRALSEDLALCQRFYERHAGALEGGFAGQSVRVGAKYLDIPVAFIAPKRVAPQLVHSSPAWVATTPTTGNEVSSVFIISSAFTGITGALSVALVMPNTRVGVLRFTAATSFDGAAGALGNVLFGAGVSIGYSADL